METELNIVFMGTPDFSARVLEGLHSKFPVACAVTGEDKPVGRGCKLVASPLKQKAIELGVPLLQFDKVSSEEGIEAISALKPDVIVTASFGQILSERFLAIPKFGVLNVHASLLPKYRGAAPIQWAIINGEKETGITIMRTVKEVDAGDILLQKSTPILERETAAQLFERLAALGAEAICEAIARVADGTASYQKQDSASATYCRMIKKADCAMDFSMTAERLDRFVRGVTPAAYCHMDGRMLKVFEVEAVPCAEHEGRVAGEVLTADPKRGLVVKVKDGAVRLVKLQAEGGKRMTDSEYLRGRSVEVGSILS